MPSYFVKIQSDSKTFFCFGFFIFVHYSSVVFESVHLQRFIKDNLNKKPKKQVANRGNGPGTYSLVIFVVSLGKDEKTRSK